MILAAVFLSPAYQPFRERVTPPALLALEARRALERARDEGARESVLLGAEAALRAGRIEERRQESRWLPFRDFGRARRGYERAVVEARAGSTDRVEARLAEVENMVRQVVALTRGMRLEEHESRSLRVARLRLDEARIEAESGRHRSAYRLGAEALAHAREGADLVRARAARYVDDNRVRRWRGWEASTIAWSRRHRASAIVVNKERNRLTLYVAGEPERTLMADMGHSHFDAKLREEDGATPEGRYRITRKKGKGRSSYYKALELSYPNTDDRRRHAEAIRSGRLSPGVGAGSSIEIHGHGGRGEDWTLGCVALSDRDIDSIFDVVRVGTPVTIIGGDGRGGRFSFLASRLRAVQGSIDAYPEY